MASKLHQKIPSEDLCKKMSVVLGSPLGRIEILGCKVGVHEIHIQQDAMPLSGALPMAHTNFRLGSMVKEKRMQHTVTLPPAWNGGLGITETLVSCEVVGAIEEMTEPLKQCTAWLQAYFCEPWMIEKLPIPPFHHPLFEHASFTREVLWTLLRDVKFGEAVSYKQLADLAGNSKAARAVGGAMRRNPVPIIIPCHRVICSGGQTGNYTGGSHLKEWLLSHEKLQKEKLAY
nr:methylated-DNA--protein-cysteine methyltransferase isoform X1 [Anolis sagrei ordinatus]XP_060624614.1 methylated-DNA--protein-cysteine methyltransferase isoform X1 [Anolis sagrei ordinatus]XP_060624615.1 methylated-DNA--protein-cysteine methyltransferase isoform X1 [Anolis sagrei ordinatus]XP_060624616.1 methylated-DNA--protein-cysteine methyltransferase isoform X1 [Anolis sagrei ordinatus]